jgi:gamma-glutamyl:cysteine ligase YbdK (ATP-grasp superfamily)
MYIRTPSGKRRALAHDSAELIERLMPIAREGGDDHYLASFKPIEKLETGADRERRRYREAGNWKGLVDDIAAQLVQDLESRQPVATQPAVPLAPTNPPVLSTD